MSPFFSVQFFSQLKKFKSLRKNNKKKDNEKE